MSKRKRARGKPEVTWRLESSVQQNDQTGRWHSRVQFWRDKDSKGDAQVDLMRGSGFATEAEALTWHLEKVAPIVAKAHRFGEEKGLTPKKFKQVVGIK